MRIASHSLQFSATDIITDKSSGAKARKRFPNIRGDGNCRNGVSVPDSDYLIVNTGDAPTVVQFLKGIGAKLSIKG